MRILIVGAGATGGSFGAKLIEAGRDVTFLVRERRAERLKAEGLRFADPQGERSLAVNAVTAIAKADHYDLVIVALKAPELEPAIEQLAPAVGPETRILPLLNGMDHLRTLEDSFPGKVLGGLVQIVATVEETGLVRQMTSLSTMTVGALDGGNLNPVIVRALDVPGVELATSTDIIGRMWAKWAFIAAAGIACCLFRAPVGRILEAGGRPVVESIIAETESVATAAGYRVSEQDHGVSTSILTEEGSGFTSSLYRDLQHGHPVEAEHILGALAERARALDIATPLLDLVLIQIRSQ